MLDTIRNFIESSLRCAYRGRQSVRRYARWLEPSQLPRTAAALHVALVFAPKYDISIFFNEGRSSYIDVNIISSDTDQISCVVEYGHHGSQHPLRFSSICFFFLRWSFPSHLKVNRTSLYKVIPEFPIKYQQWRICGNERKFRQS